MVLQYINGSPCGSSDSRKSHDKDEDLDDRAPKEAKGHRRRSTTISFHCDREQISPRAVASFVATDPDQCAYFFEVRSAYACPTVNEVQTGLGPAGVFGVIVLIAVCVYFLGGVMYQRSVAHARGWRQLPNYSLWAGIGSFFHVSGEHLLPRLGLRRAPRVASVRSYGGDGGLPTMEHRPLTRGLNRSSRSSATYSYPP
jgi:cation-dependent mannose-6-phosphate receptor